jgi:hypothetical protein
MAKAAVTIAITAKTRCHGALLDGIAVCSRIGDSKFLKFFDTAGNFIQSQYGRRVGPPKTISRSSIVGKVLPNFPKRYSLVSMELGHTPGSRVYCKHFLR